MVDNRPQADRILGAQLMGSAKRLGRRELPAEEHAAAVAELRELAGGRADLLAETAGLLEGFGEGEPDGPLNRLAVQLCRDAGADEEAIPAWAEEGRRRRTRHGCRRSRAACEAGERGSPDRRRDYGRSAAGGPSSGNASSACRRRNSRKSPPCSASVSAT